VGPHLRVEVSVDSSRVLWKDHDLTLLLSMSFSYYLSLLLGIVFSFGNPLFLLDSSLNLSLPLLSLVTLQLSLSFGLSRSLEGAQLSFFSLFTELCSLFLIDCLLFCIIHTILVRNLRHATWQVWGV
jgi:hypothetical protein